MALGDVLNLGTRIGSGGTSTYSPTIAAATAGSLLVCYVSVTVAGRTCTTPAGWTAGPTSSGGSNLSSHIFWKEAAGGETGVTMTLSGSGGGYANIIEIDATGADLSAIDASANDVTNIDTPTASQPTGTAVGSASNGIAVAFFGVDNGADVSTGRAYTNSFTEQDTSDTANASRGGYFLASKVITGASNDSTFTHTGTDQEMFGSIITFSATATFGIDTPPSTTKAGTAFDVVVSAAATTPTTGNTEVKFTDDTGVAATVNSVTGTGPWTINCTFPTSTAIQFSSTGYPLYVEVAAENATTANIPYTPATGYDFTDLVSPVTTSGSILEGYTGDAPVTGDQVVFTTPTSPDSIVFTVSATGEWTLNSAPGGDQTVDRYVIQANGTIGAENTVTYTGTGGGGGDTTPPVISVTGSTSIQLVLDATYTELGATWTDNVDGAGAATVGGDTVDTSTAGTYVVTYNHTDAAGNPATQRTRTVKVGGAVSTLIVSDFPATEVVTANDLQQPLIKLHQLCRRSSAEVARQIEDHVNTIYFLMPNALTGTPPDATVAATAQLKALYVAFTGFDRAWRIKMERVRKLSANVAVQAAMAAQLQFWLEKQGWTFA